MRPVQTGSVDLTRFGSGFADQPVLTCRRSTFARCQQCEVVFGSIDQTLDTRVALSSSLVECSKQLPSGWGAIDWRLGEAGKGALLEASSPIELHHGRGRDEFACRALKDFGTERMPFEGLFPNMAFYSGDAPCLQSLRGVQG